MQARDQKPFRIWSRGEAVRDETSRAWPCSSALSPAPNPFAQFQCLLLSRRIKILQRSVSMTTGRRERLPESNVHCSDHCEWMACPCLLGSSCCCATSLSLDLNLTSFINADFSGFYLFGKNATTWFDFRASNFIEKKYLLTGSGHYCRRVTQP